MKAASLFFIGIVSVVTGAFVRLSVMGGSSHQLLNGWCGPGQGASYISIASHGHCAGCLLIATGLLAMALASTAAIVRRPLLAADETTGGRTQ